MTQKKIVFFLFDLGLGGTEQVIVKLSNFLITQGQDVHILCVGDRDDFLNKLNNKITISNFGKKRIYESFLPLIKFIRNEEFDSFVSNVWPLTFISVVSGFFSKGFLEKLILIEHCHLKEEFKKRGSLFKIFQKIRVSKNSRLVKGVFVFFLRSTALGGLFWEHTHTLLFTVVMNA